MKKITLLITLFTIAFMVNAQTDGINYQAVIIDNNPQEIKINDGKRQSHYMLNYNVMAIFFFIALLAFKMDSWLSLIFAIIGFIISSPSIQFNRPLYRWILLGIIAILLIFIFPDLSLLKDKI